MSALRIAALLLGSLPLWAGGTPEARPPALLSETGLYSGPGAATVDPRNRPYAPQYPLWSDGAAKSRWIRLPAGTPIDASDDDAWRFPEGTKLWKEFVIGGRKVETRLLWRADGDAWVYAAYVWNANQSEATLAPETGLPRAAEVAPGKYHAVPSVSDCRACHEAGPARVLGFNALQLSDDRDPGAPHAEPLEPRMLTNRLLIEQGLLAPARHDLIERPPRIRASSALERSVLGYLASNCGGCHNRSGDLAALGLVLSHDSRQGEAEPGLTTSLNLPGHYAIPGLPSGETRIVDPGAPERSSLVHRMISRRPSSQMPPLGTVLADEEAVEMTKRWIVELGSPRGAGARSRGVPQIMTAQSDGAHHPKRCR